MKKNERYVKGLTGNICVFEYGNQSGLPILAVHGWLDNAASFEPLSGCMDRYRWLCIELPGHGRSDCRPTGSVYHFTDYVADVYKVVENLGLRRFVLLGHSLGAGIGAAFAAVFPDKVDRLVLIDGIGPVSGEDDDSLGQLKKSMAYLEKQEEDGPRVYRSWEGLIEKRLAAGKIKRSSAEILLRRGTEIDGENIRVLSDGRLKQHSPVCMSRKKVVSILRGIEAPTRLILAGSGAVGKSAFTEERIRAIKNVTVKTVDGGHHLHMDEPARVAEEIEDFLTGASR